MLPRLSHAIQLGWQRPRWINRLLYPLSLGYAGLMSARRRAYQIGILQRHKLPAPVVVVGNLSFGGVGKTPLLIELAAYFQSRGLRPGVVTRGYRGRSTVWPREVVEGVTAEEVGDEPVLIFRRCGAPIIAGPDRPRGARMLAAEHGCDIILSDDGFQHHALQRDLDIVVIDGQRRLGNGWCLPAGPLREPPEALARAGMIVVNGESAEVEEVKNMSVMNMPAANVHAMHVRIDRAVQMAGAPTRMLGEFAGQAVHAVAGIGNPERFFQQLEAVGLSVTRHPYPDHHRFTPADLAFAADGAAVLMTEKDAVKCEALLATGAVEHCRAEQCWAVPLRVTLSADFLPAVFDRVIEGALS